MNRVWRTASLSLGIVLSALLAPDLAAQSFRLQTEAAGLASAMDNNGVAVADYDLDGDLDIYLVAYRQYDPNDETTWNRLYRNEGNGTFADVTLEAGVLSRVAGFDEGGMGNKFGAAWGDYDNDGDPDLFLTNIGPEILYRNEGDGTFTDVTEQAGVADEDSNYSASSSALWWDYDHDGDLDLYVSAWAGSVSSKVSENKMYENQGDGTFTNVTAASGLGDRGRTWTSIPLDANNDGLTDLYVVNDYGPNKFYVNQGDKFFLEATAAFGLEDNGHGMGVTVGDFNNDSYFDIYLTNIAEFYPNPLFVNDGQGYFSEQAEALGVHDAGWAWGTEFFDCDHDGDLDLYVANGFMIDPGNNFFFTNQLVDRSFLRFEDSSVASGTDGAAEARGLVVFDYDGDGDQDMLVANWDAPPSLYRNQSATQNWLGIQLDGTTPSRNAFGAVVSVTANGKTIYRQHDGVDFLGQSIKPLHFGVGAAGIAEAIHVRWPSGVAETFYDVPANQTITLKEGQGTATATEERPIVSEAVTLQGAFPNPTTDATTITFSLPRTGPVNLTVYNLLGQAVFTHHETYSAGPQRITLNNDQHFKHSGLYLYRLTFENTIRTGELMYVR